MIMNIIKHPFFYFLHDRTMYVNVTIVTIINSEKCVFTVSIVGLGDSSSRGCTEREREGNIERLGVGERPNNFPPFPKFCPTPF